jgi:hypothetical protein
MLSSPKAITFPATRLMNMRPYDCATSSKSINDIVSVACKQDVSRDRYPKGVAADEGNLNEYADNREHRENQGD